ncbi:hypothetical protein [Rubrivivax gelatinosus]|uniref:hypothetical protein n=1 Tax=Rubrivivax gelatinosus TaxID=28068 RepID=UPI0012FD5BDA|nr:hypothetical protein [Rubrivivax gelatinosus]MBG6083137.1 hypothetical protein [Rubrivivax gelatinosus]
MKADDVTAVLLAAVADVLKAMGLPPLDLRTPSGTIAQHLRDAAREISAARQSAEDAWRPLCEAPAGVRVLLGPRSAPVVGVVRQPPVWADEQEPYASVTHYNGSTLVANYRCSEWRYLNAGALHEQGETGPTQQLLGDAVVASTDALLAHLHGPRTPVHEVLDELVKAGVDNALAERRLRQPSVEALRDYWLAHRELLRARLEHDAASGELISGLVNPMNVEAHERDALEARNQFLRGAAERTRTARNQAELRFEIAAAALQNPTS